MRPLPPQFIDCPSIVYVAEYYRAGRKRVMKAVKRHAALMPWHALIQLHVDSKTKKIRGKSARKYIQEDIRALKLVLRWHGRSDLFPALEPRLVKAINDRRGRPAKYGAGNKNKDVSEQEAIAAFRELKRNALSKGCMTDVYAALFVLIASHTGVRPCELIEAELSESKLTLQNAKLKPGLGRHRTLSLQDLPEDLLTAIALMIEIMPKFRFHLEYKNWAKNVAEALARACERAGIRRLALYSFRHVALATWKRAGVSGAELSAMAGHLSERSAKTYAGAKHGHVRETIARAENLSPELNDGPTLLRSSTAPATGAETALSKNVEAVDDHELQDAGGGLAETYAFEDMPRPPALPKPEKMIDARPHFERLALDAIEAVERIRAADKVLPRHNDRERTRGSPG